jgi:hypothetical protein
MTIRHTGKWLTITAIAMAKNGSSLWHGASIYVADATDDRGSQIRIRLHNDEYGYRVLPDRATANPSWSASPRVRRAAPAYTGIR